MLRVAVIGAGRIGKIHAANVARHPRTRLSAVADPIEAAARALAQAHQCEWTAQAPAHNTQLRQQELQQAQERQAQPLLVGLAAYVSKCWDAALLSKRPIETQMLKNI